MSKATVLKDNLDKKERLVKRHDQHRTDRKKRVSRSEISRTLREIEKRNH